MWPLSSSVRPQQVSPLNDDQWSKDIAVLVADALSDGGLIDQSKIPQAAEIIAKEIWIRFLCKDYPPGATDPSKRPGEQKGHPPRDGG